MKEAERYGEVIGRGAVCFRRLLPGPIERVWEHLVDGDKRGRWLCSGNTGSAVGEKVEMIFRNDDLTNAPDSPPPDVATRRRCEAEGRSHLVTVARLLRRCAPRDDGRVLIGG